MTSPSLVCTNVPHPVSHPVSPHTPRPMDPPALAPPMVIERDAISGITSFVASCAAALTLLSVTLPCDAGIEMGNVDAHVDMATKATCIAALFADSPVDETYIAPHLVDAITHMEVPPLDSAAVFDLATCLATPNEAPIPVSNDDRPSVVKMLRRSKSANTTRRSKPINVIL